MATSKKQLAALKQHGFKPGQSGNPAGRSKGRLSIVAAIKDYLEQHPEELQAIVKAFINKAKMGQMQAVQELVDRIDGKVAEKHELEARLPVTLVFQPAPAQVPALEAPPAATAPPGLAEVLEGQYEVLEDGGGTEHLAGGHPLARMTRA